MARKKKKDDNSNKYHVRTLKEYDSDGRVTGVHIVNDLDAMILDHMPELREKYEEIQKKVPKGKLYRFPE